MSKKSPVWEHFEKIKSDQAQCNITPCCAKISCKGGNTTAMINHLLHFHKIKIRKTENQDPEPAKKAKMCLPAFFPYIDRESLNEILAKCAAKDGFSFHSIAQSEAIRGFVASRNYSLPKSSTTIQKYVMEFFEEKKEAFRKAIANLLKCDKRVSMTVDEWTDITMRRYINITLHSTNTKFVLGLVKINGCCTSEKLADLVQNRLLEYGVELDKHVVASTHDGANVMVKYGKLIGIISQLCYNHAIHLVVVKTLYKKISAETAEREVLLEENSDGIEDEEDDERDVRGNFYDDGNLLFGEDVETQDFSICLKIRPALESMRKIIRFFKISAIRSEILSTHVIAQEGKNLKLILDCKTRWNTLISSINRFLKLINCINTALDEMGLEKFDDEYTKVLREVSLVLEPLMLAIQELSKEDCNLISAEGTLMYVLKKLKEINTALSLELFDSFKTQIEERRQKDVITLLLFLHHGIHPKNNEFFNYSSKFVTRELAKKLIKSLYQTEVQQVDMSGSSSSSDEREQQKTEYEELQKFINNLTAVSAKKTTANLNIDKEFKFLELNPGKRSQLMENLYQALLTINPTSTACERVFSVAGNLITKLRSRLSSYNLNGLVFLKYYFLQNQKTN